MLLKMIPIYDSFCFQNLKIHEDHYENPRNHSKYKDASWTISHRKSKICLCVLWFEDSAKVGNERQFARPFQDIRMARLRSKTAVESHRPLQYMLEKLVHLEEGK